MNAEIAVGKVLLIGVTGGTGSNTVGSFPFAVQPDKPLHLIATKDMGRVAAHVMKHRSQYVGQEIELAGDVLTPKQMVEAFSRAQGRPVVYKEIPPWIFLLLFRKRCLI